MIDPNPVLIETTRGPITENRHRAAAAISTVRCGVIESWGDIETPILPRSSVKMLQALPLVESGAAHRQGLESDALALACASHIGAPMHSDRVRSWLRALGLEEDVLLCGVQRTRDPALRRTGMPPAKALNSCSGKHAGFVTLSTQLGAPLAEYLEVGGAVQRKVSETFSEMTDTATPLQHGIDGCSAPNFAASLRGLSSAMAQMADPAQLGAARGDAACKLVDAMRAHPMLISGEGKACTLLIGACEGRAVVKYGADGVYTGILPGRGVGFALKVDDGQPQAAEALCAELLARLDVLGRDHPTYQRYAHTPIQSLKDETVGARRVVLHAADV